MIKELDFLLVFGIDKALGKEFTEKTNVVAETLKGIADDGSKLEFAQRWFKKFISSKKRKKLLDRSKAFIRFLKRKYKTAIRLENIMLGIPREVSFLLPVPWNPSEKTRHHFSLGGLIVPGTGGQYYEVLSFSNDTMGVNYPAYVDFFNDLFLNACHGLKPIFGTANEKGSTPAERPCYDEAEYYRDPYFFCVEPSFGPQYGAENFDFSFLSDSRLLAKLAEIKKVIRRAELVEIIRKHAERLVESEDGSVGVLKNKYPQAVYPRYFVRRELRRRGIELGEGLAEKYAKQMESKGRLL